MAKAEHAKPEPNLKHNTFDSAQQLEVPQRTRQVGPLCFKSRFRIQLCVHDEAAHRQINFIFYKRKGMARMEHDLMNIA